MWYQADLGIEEYCSDLVTDLNRGSKYESELIGPVIDCTHELVGREKLLVKEQLEHFFPMDDDIEDVEAF